MKFIPLPPNHKKKNVRLRLGAITLSPLLHARIMDPAVGVETSRDFIQERRSLTTRHVLAILPGYASPTPPRSVRVRCSFSGVSTSTLVLKSLVTLP